jgi:ketosteroid isomerase-like protein
MSLYIKSSLIVCLIAFTLIESPAKDDRAAADVKELTRLETVWNEAHLRGDAQALDRLWAEDLFVTVPNMPVMNKEESMAIWRSGRMKFDVYKTSDLRIRVYGDAAVVTGQLERIRNSNNQAFEDDWRFTKVYVRRGSKWLVVTWHGSHVAQ